jgi:hypothetical protein
MQHWFRVSNPIFSGETLKEDCCCPTQALLSERTKVGFIKSLAKSLLPPRLHDLEPVTRRRQQQLARLGEMTPLYRRVLCCDFDVAQSPL